MIVRHRRRRFRLVVAVLVALSVGAAGCGGGGSSGSGSKAATQHTLTIGLPTPPTTMNPAKAVLQGPLYYPAYEPLVYQADDGYRPGLAESYGYEPGSGNTLFRVTLRKN